MLGAELLISDNQEKVDYLSKKLNDFNEDRKKIEFGLIFHMDHLKVTQVLENG